MNQEVEEQQYLFKLNDSNPFNQKDIIIIGLIDASGSMIDVWPHLVVHYNQLVKNYDHHTITFSNSSKYIGNSNLNPQIKVHGGQGTEIMAGFNELNKILNAIGDKNVIVLFVSDGHDNNSKTLKDRLQQLVIPNIKYLNFICIGIGSDFPTFISMQLRSMYHKGDDCVPPLFLLETDIENKQFGFTETKSDQDLAQIFKEQFSQIPTVFRTRSKLQTSPCLQFPWDKQLQEYHWAGSWVISSQPQLNINNQLVNYNIITIEDMIDLGKYWLQNLQVKALQVQVLEQASIAHKIYHHLLTKMQKGGNKMTFAQKIKQKHLTQNQLEEVQAILKELKNLSQSDYLSKLSEAEAAKRIAIGTQIGKYHNKAVQLKGITVDDYVKDRQAFIEILRNTQLQPSDTERSIISFENQKEIFTQPDFIEGLLVCPNQYELVTSLPVIGYGVQIKRFDGSMINPWIIEVKSMARFHKYVDSLAIYGAKDNTLILQTGDGDKEQINCVLPLYTYDNADIGVLLQQKLFHLLMTFNVMQNADTCFDTAYSALLSNCFLYLILESKSQWRDELIKLIKQTFDITYRNKYKFYTEELMKNPKLAVVTEHPNIKTKCEDPCKPLLILETIKNDLTKEQIKSILDPIIIEAIARGADQQFSQYFQIQPKEFDPTPIFDQLTQDIIKNAPENLVAAFYRKQELLDYLDEKILALNKIQFDCQIELNIDKIKSQQRKYCYNNLQIIYKYFLGEEFSNELYIQALNHGQINNSYERSQAQIETDLEKIKLIVKQRLGQELKNSNKIKEQCLAILYPKLQQQFKITHKIAHIFPSIQGVQNIEQYKVTDSNLVSNACLCEQCPHYLKVMPTFNEHMKIDYELPAFHKTIKQNILKSKEEIFELIGQGACLTKVDQMPFIDVQSMIEEREELLEQIEYVKVEYLKFLQNK